MKKNIRSIKSEIEKKRELIKSLILNDQFDESANNSNDDFKKNANIVKLENKIKNNSINNLNDDLKKNTKNNSINISNDDFKKNTKDSTNDFFIKTIKKHEDVSIVVKEKTAELYKNNIKINTYECSDICLNSLNDNIYICLLSNDKEKIKILSLKKNNEIDNINTIEDVMEYEIRKGSQIKMEIDENNTLWLFVCDNLNLKMFGCVNNNWENIYRILYHNDCELTNINITRKDNLSLIIELTDEKNVEKKFKINEKMFRLDKFYEKKICATICNEKKI